MKKEISTENNVNNFGKHSRPVFFLVLIITAIVFSGSLTLNWTNWDDDLYIYENPLVTEGAFKEIFTTLPASNTYNPLVLTSFALEWKLVKDKPFLYHLDNLLFHLLCTVLAWFFFRSMGLSVLWSGFASLLFGIHPLRVESVAWITERKDLLYAFFYLAAMQLYIRYIAYGKYRQLLLTFLFFILALLSKGLAMTFPFVLILLDWYFQRKEYWKMFLEKVAFFGVSIIFFLVSIFFFTKNANFLPNSNPVKIFDQIILSGYAYMLYILKSIIPYEVCIIYPIPSFLTAVHWIGAVIAILIFTFALAVWRKYRFITFGIIFFTINIFFLLFLPLWASDTAFQNDRYSYLAYTGLFFVTAMGFQKLSREDGICRPVATGIAVIMLVALGILTIKYIPVWNNSETLWTYVIEKYPHKIATAYLNRGKYLQANNYSDIALDDFSKAIEIKPDFLAAYRNRSVAHFERGEIEKALKDENIYIEILTGFNIKNKIANTLLSEAIANRGVMYSKMGQYEKALIEYDQAINLNPANSDNYLNRAFVYMQLRDYDKCIRDLNICHQYNPANADIINNRGVCYLRYGDFKSALNDFSQAIAMDDRNPSYYVNRSHAYYNLGRIAEAQKDIMAAEETGAINNSIFEKLPLQQ